MFAGKLETAAVIKLPKQEDFFEQYESSVRSYCRVFPAVFARGEGSYLFDKSNNKWLDFLSGAGSLNYGHNHPQLKRALLSYIESDGIVNSLDMYTHAKKNFLQALNHTILKPRGLKYKCQFCGPTGTNAVEAALKLAKKVTQRNRIVSFSNSYHGMSAGSMSVSSSFRRRNELYLNSDLVTFLPFEGFTGLKDEISFIRKMMATPGSGIMAPAAFIVELVQGEGGINIASTNWVQSIYQLSRELGALFIVDEIQTGCGRTGKFFSFEHHDIVPDIVCISKSISGFGLPMSMLLINPSLDIWKPGEHNGTFRGFTYSFITAAEAINHFWSKQTFIDSLSSLSNLLEDLLADLKNVRQDLITTVQKIGMMVGIKTREAKIANKIQKACFERGLIIETCGPDGSTIKLLPPLTVKSHELEMGIRILQDTFYDTAKSL